MIKKIAITIVMICLVYLGLAFMQPDAFSAQRSTTITAPPEKIIALIDNFHSWGSWSPWEHLDPAMKRSFSGAASNKGAVYGWEGNDKVGAGRMEITDETAPSKVVIKLDFFKPFSANNMTEFTLEPKGDATTVTWKMSGPQPFVTKLMTVFASMDSMIGKDFEKGLANMKAVAEKK
jgi:hypothetical protein